MNGSTGTAAAGIEKEATGNRIHAMLIAIHFEIVISATTEEETVDGITDNLPESPH